MTILTILAAMAFALAVSSMCNMFIAEIVSSPEKTENAKNHRITTLVLFLLGLPWLLLMIFWEDGWDEMADYASRTRENARSILYGQDW